MSTTRAIVLARGLGTRMRALDPSAHLPEDQRRAADAGSKATLPVGGRPYLDYVLSAIADAGIHHVGLIVAPDHEALARYYRAEAPPTRLDLDFIVQPDVLGTADAVRAAEQWAAGVPFLAMNADNVYPAGVLSALAALDQPGLPIFERGDLVRSSNIPEARVWSFALLDVDDKGYLRGIVEKPSPRVVAASSGRILVSMNCWRFDRRVFEACRDVNRSPRGELELPAAVALAIERGVEFKGLPACGPVLDLSTRADAAEVTRRLEGVIPRP
ncbi:MAG: NTP transferase domain-containing protein [Acidobacteria bacterium]|nr:NTP transferase domain-containing protein [Acidobacteriota bacterium]